jgi:hypothetical protein
MKLEFLNGEFTQNGLLGFRMGKLELMNTRSKSSFSSDDVKGV